MHNLSRGWMVLAVWIGLAPVHVSAAPEAPEASEAPEVVEVPNHPSALVLDPEGERPLPPLEVALRFGPSFGWYMGAGHLELELRARLSDGLQLVPSVRVAGGLGTDDRNYLESGGELGLRVGRIRDVSGHGHFGVGALFLGELRESGGVSHVYAVPFGRLGGGIRLATEGRLAWGVEGAARFGYAVHRTPGLSDDPSGVAADRSSFFGNLDISLILSF